jgi:hypothetical protein
VREEQETGGGQARPDDTLQCATGVVVGERGGICFGGDGGWAWDVMVRFQLDIIELVESVPCVMERSDGCWKPR